MVNACLWFSLSRGVEERIDHPDATPTMAGTRLKSRAEPRRATPRVQRASFAVVSLSPLRLSPTILPIPHRPLRATSSDPFQTLRYQPATTPSTAAFRPIQPISPLIITFLNRFAILSPSFFHLRAKSDISRIRSSFPFPSFPPARLIAFPLQIREVAVR